MRKDVHPHSSTVYPATYRLITGTARVTNCAKICLSVDLSSSGNFPIHSFLKNQKFRHMLLRCKKHAFYKESQMCEILAYIAMSQTLGGRIMYGNICSSEGMFLPPNKSLPLHFPREKGTCPFICFVRKKCLPVIFSIKTVLAPSSE